jgi:hypothetical protein
LDVRGILMELTFETHNIFMLFLGSIKVMRRSGVSSFGNIS